MSEDEIWQWAGTGTPDKRPDRGRIYYKSVTVHRRGTTRKRTYNVGDPVVMAGDDGQVWIAQIVNLFQAHENDMHIKELIRNSAARNDDERRHELMRCTLRWFYNLADMNQHTLNTSRVPKPIPDEIWFSDHVEQDGFNDVQVIEGKAWLFPSMHAKHAFLKDPEIAYNPRKDKLCIVRCFVDSKSEHLPVRELERAELERLLRFPTTDKDLFENSRLRLYGSTGAVLKGTGKKKRRHTTIRSPVNVDEDEFAPTPKGKKSRIVEAKVELDLKGAHESERTKSRSIRRRKILDNDDEDDSGSFRKPDNTPVDPTDEDDQPLTNRIQELDQQQQAEARSLQKENDEVVAWVTELNNSAYGGDQDEKPKPSKNTAQAGKPSMAVEVNEVAVVGKRGSSHRRGEVNGKQPKQYKTKRRETETIVIDDDGDADEILGRKLEHRPKVPTHARSDKKQNASRQARHPSTGKSAFAGKPFMPTQRARKPSSAAAAKGTSSAAAAKSASLAPAAKNVLSRTSAKNSSSAPSTKKTPSATPTKKTSSAALARSTSAPTAKSAPSSSMSRAGTAVPQKRTSEPRPIRHSLEKASSSLKKPSEKSHARKGVPQSSTQQERTSRHHARPADTEFLTEITDSMERMKLSFADMPSDSKSIMKGNMEWLVGSVIDKMFDGSKERANDVGDSEARKIVDLTFMELQGMYARGQKGSRNADKLPSGR